MCYNTKYYHHHKLHSLNPKRDSVWTYVCSDGTIIGMFQGNRGLYPDLDFQIKELLPGSNNKMFTPAHYDWVVDVLIKSHFFPSEMSRLLEYYIDFYDNKCIPFESQEERDSHLLITVPDVSATFSNVTVERTLSIDALAVLFELFCYCEKRNQPVAHQFRDALQKMKDYSNGKVNIAEVMHLVCAHF